jgi:hypothetical protein
MSLLFDGFPITATFLSVPPTAGTFRVKRMQPSGFDGGGRIDGTSMQSLRVRSGAPKSLMTGEQIKMTVYYDPILFRDMPGLMQRNGNITITFPDASSVVFYGWIEKFTPPDHQEGENPLAEIIVEISNHTGSTSLLNGSLVTTFGTEFVPTYNAPIQARGPF